MTWDNEEHDPTDWITTLRCEVCDTAYYARTHLGLGVDHPRCSDHREGSGAEVSVWTCVAHRCEMHSWDQYRMHCEAAHDGVPVTVLHTVRQV